MHYVVITDSSFLSDLLNDGDIWQCNIVTAKWVVDHGYGFYSDSAGDPATIPWDNPVAVPAPVAESGVVLNAAPTEVVIDFNSAIAVTDSTGMTVSGGGTSILSVAAAGDQLTITMSTAIANGETITFDYVAAGGNLVAAGQGDTAVADITDMPVDNQVAA